MSRPHRTALLLALLSLAPAVPVCADVIVRDEGEQGIVLTNRDLPLAPPTRSMGQSAAWTAPRASAGTARRAQQFAPLVRATARAHGLPAALLQAVVEVESGFDAAAVSPKGATGLMQLMPGTARALSVANPRDPAANLDGGARYLKELLALHGNDLSLALAAYNAGPGAVQRSGGVPPFAETQRYIPRVISRYHSLQAGSRD